MDASSNAITPTTASTMSFDFGNNTPLITGCTLNTLTDINGASVSVVTSGDLVKATMTIQAFTQLNVMNQLPAIIQDAYNLIPTVQIITFSAAPPSGTFEISLAVTSTLSISTTSTAAINWNDSNQTVTNKINAILPSGYVTLGGSLASGILILSFTNVNPTVLSIVANSTGETTTIDTNLAYEAQLDVLAKYAGVKRNGNGPSGAVTLHRLKSYTLIQLGIITNNFGSSLADIDNLLFTFFQGNIRVFDNQQMQLAYTVNGAYFSNALLDCIYLKGFFRSRWVCSSRGLSWGQSSSPFVTHKSRRIERDMDLTMRRRMRLIPRGSVRLTRYKGERKWQLAKYQERHRVSSGLLVDRKHSRNLEPSPHPTRQFPHFTQDRR